jgi:large subunit ribosomal protein L10
LALTKKRKEDLVAQYLEWISQSNAIFLTEYTGLSVKQLQSLRVEVRKAESAFHVTKNRLLRLALEQSGKSVPAELLTGQLSTGFALKEAPTLAKALSDFAKREEQLVIKGGFLGDDLLSADQVLALAKLPTMEELHAQILGLIQAPARNLAAVVAGSVRQVVNVLDAYATKEGEAAAAA